jgi:D-serine deaminase-like pyridoxal phosphate-dependent protein
MWIPRSVKGYSAADMRGMAPGGSVETNVSKWDLDTPALCVDLTKLERNIERMQSALRRNGLASRPHAKTHKTPEIARLQLKAGSVGICVAKLSEAEVMFQHGIDRILMTTVNVSAPKIARAMQLRTRCPQFIQAVDNPQNARDLSAAAKAAGVTADIVVDVDPGGHRTGIAPGQPAIELARLVAGLPNLKLRGILAYDGGAQHVKGFQKRREQALKNLAAPAETYAALKSAGMGVDIFSGGGTGTYNIQHETPGVTDLQVGSYVFMDAQYLEIGAPESDVNTDFEPSLTVLTTILNANFDGRATSDAGAKALTINEPDPIVVGERGIFYRARSDEFGSLRYENPSRVYKVGDKLEVIVPHCDPAVNLYDQMYGIRNDRVEVVWPIAARGKSQ